MSNALDIKDYGDISCPEYAGNICHTLKKKETELNNVKRELEVYKKTLEMLAYDTAYEPMGTLEKRMAFKKEHAQKTIEKYLKKAGEDE